MKNKPKRMPESSMAGRVLGQCFLKNHQGGLYRVMIGLLLLVGMVPTLAAQSALAAADPLTTEERAWLKAHPDIELGYPGAFEPAVIVNEDGSYRGTLVDILALLNQRLGTDFKLTVKSIPDIISQVSRKALGGVLSIHPGHADKYGWLKTKPYMNSYPTVFTKKGFTFTRPFDLAGKKIALIDKIFFSQKLVDRYGAGGELDPDLWQKALCDVPLLRPRASLLQQDLQAGGCGTGKVKAASGVGVQVSAVYSSLTDTGHLIAAPTAPHYIRVFGVCLEGCGYKVK